MTDGERVSGLNDLAPYPAAIELPDQFDRREPAPAVLRSLLFRIAAHRDWSVAGWSELISGLLALGRADVPLSRLAEGHIDAVRILHQAGQPPVPDALYGVWASRSQRTGVRAVRDGRILTLDGTIKFASGVGVVDRALVPVWFDGGEHALLDLSVSELPADTGQWATPAMAVTRSHTVPLAGLRVDVETQVGPTDFYLSRPGFFPGGVGVAACWAGCAARIADLTASRLRDPGAAIRVRLGRIRLHLAVAGAVLQTAGSRLDGWFSSGVLDSPSLRTLSTEARAAVATAVHGVLDEAHRVAGPAGLAFDADLSRAVHDLRLYVLQQNADADEAFLGERS